MTVVATNRSSLLWAAGSLVTLMLLALGTWCWRSVESNHQRQRGEAIYRGHIAVAGRLVGHELDLPTMATRCSNCHEAPSATPGAAPFALALTGQRLQSPQTRRGGPPSVFNSQRLCELLRTGIDPAHVIISTTMPRYMLTDAQCADLWAFLAAR